MSLMSCGAEADNRQTHVTYHCDHWMSRTVTGSYSDCRLRSSHEGDTLYFLGCRFSLSHPHTLFTLKPNHTQYDLFQGYWIWNQNLAKLGDELLFCILKIFPQREESLYHYKCEIRSNTRTRGMSWWLLNHCYYTCSCWSMSSNVTLIPIS